MKLELEGSTLVLHRGNVHTGISIYKPSEWLYLMTGWFPEKCYDFCDKVRWWLETKGW